MFSYSVRLVLVLFLFTGNTGAAQNCVCTLLDRNSTLPAQTLLGSTEKICQATGYIQKAGEYIQSNHLDSAQEALTNAAKILEKAACPEDQKIPLFKAYTSYHFLMAEYQPAINYSLKLLPLFQQKNDIEGEADILLGVAQIFSRMGQTSKGLQYLQQSAPLLSRLPDQTTKADLLNKAGSRYYFFLSGSEG